MIKLGYEFINLASQTEHALKWCISSCKSHVWNKYLKYKVVNRSKGHRKFNRGYTVDLEIFVVKIFSWFAQTTKMNYILQCIFTAAKTFLFAQFSSTAS